MTKLRGRRYGPVGQCIYCGETNPPLTEEHAMPANMNGDLILVDASCTKCQQDINRQVETPCLEWSRNTRYRRQIGMRGVKKRKKTLTLSVRPHPQWQKIVPIRSLHEPWGDWESRDVPYDQHPAFMRLEAFKTPGVLRGLSPEESVRDYMAGWQWVHAEHFTPNPYFHSVRSSMPFEVVTFARLIAKIAHCITVRAEGVDGFEPFLTDIIRGKDLSKLWYFVGGLDTRPIPYGRPL
jgi:hypothetical protein